MAIMGVIRQVWSNNVDEELSKLSDYLQIFPIVSVDTEFPGFIRKTHWRANYTELYNNVRYNVSQTNLIQLGITLSDDTGTIGPTWEFNFADFDPETDPQGSDAVLFLINHGFDFKKMRKDGILMKDFRHKFIPFMRDSRISKWVTFHGIYDIAYLLKMFVDDMDDFPTLNYQFSLLTSDMLGNVSDLKEMARYCKGLKGGKLGLEKLAKLLEIERIGMSHQAGSDSLLTALLYAKMKQQFQDQLSHCSYMEGYLYGVGYKIQRPFRLTGDCKPSWDDYI